MKIKIGLAITILTLIFGAYMKIEAGHDEVLQYAMKVNDRIDLDKKDDVIITNNRLIREQKEWIANHPSDTKAIEYLEYLEEQRDRLEKEKEEIIRR